ncbi:hypothetical protein AK812_SmicGene34267 [Symbiodinium microadriaticum]|uniref:Uncharacterized protein n=1 Tax=Symbiodinium microadriaticum TaxID=2951 RepID=A0A1Q9CPG3_SYMMI|nr:hypothetical protein AK812_SmicGene34267 [Symbiodinium microadriaticum]
MKRLREVRKQIAEYDQEEESDEGLAKLWEATRIPTEQLEQELAAVDKRVASLEDQLSRVRAGGTKRCLDICDALGSFLGRRRVAAESGGAPRRSPQAISLGALCLASSQQPGLHDRRVQEMVVLLAEMAEVVPRNQRVAAIRELLAEIAEQAAATEVV